MTDIVQELRYSADDHDGTGYVMVKAATEIERLRAALEAVADADDIMSARGAAHRALTNLPLQSHE